MKKDEYEREADGRFAKIAKPGESAPYAPPLGEEYLLAEGVEENPPFEDNPLVSSREMIVDFSHPVDEEDFSMALPQPIEQVCDVLVLNRMRPLVVGGSVRDAALGVDPKDIDLEVYGGDLDKITNALRARGYKVDEVGKEFGVLKIYGKGVEDLDVSVPRLENRVGAGHRGFTVETKDLSVEEAASRRDYTINSMMYDPKSGELIDPYNGKSDLENGILRHTSDAFTEDSLRVWRGFQISARFGMQMDEKTVTLCRSILHEAPDLTKERVSEEWTKFYSKGQHPAHGLAVLRATHWDTAIPGLAEANNDNLRGQASTSHWIATTYSLNDSQKTQLIAATIAKSITNPVNREQFLKQTVLRDAVRNKTSSVLKASPPENVNNTSLRKWARELSKSDISISDWAHLETVTGNARKSETILEQAKALGCNNGAITPMLQGRDVMAISSRKPGPWVGEVLAKAVKAQDEGLFSTKEEAASWLNLNLPKS